MRRTIPILSLCAIGLAAGIGVWQVLPLWTKEITESELFYPQRRHPPADQPDRRLVEIPVERDLALRGWLLPHPGARTTLIYVYGNGDTVAGSAHRLTWLREALRVSVLAMDYRGYGFSDGAPSLQALLDDILRVFDHWRDEWARPDEAVAMYGRSIGTVPAIYLAAHRPVDGLILETPFPNVESVVAAWGRTIPVPLRWLVRLRPAPSLADRRPQPEDLIPTYHGPLLVLHGDRDTIVPIELGRRMFTLSPSPEKTFCEVPRAGHNDLHLHQPPAREALTRFVHILRRTE